MPPDEVYEALLDVRGWWSGLYNETFDGASEKPGDIFSFNAGDGAHYSKQRLTEAVPGKRIRWTVIEGSLSFVEHRQEWEGTSFGFDLEPADRGTKITFIHHGLTPQLECYSSCAPAWTSYIADNRLNLGQRS